MASNAGDSGWEYLDDSIYLTDFWTAQMESGNPEDPLKQWLSAFENWSTASGLEDSAGQELISNPFFEYWRIMVPRLLSFTHGKSCLDQRWNEERINYSLLRPLEAFICGTNNGIDAIFTELSSNDCPPAICGHVFQSGEPCYSCRDCGQDATCVMCSECFQHSIHKNHRYRMSTSDGGGYCDCGDKEAFADGALCTQHAANKEKTITTQELLHHFPEDLKARTKELLCQIIKYVFKVTNHKRTDRDFMVGGKERETWPELDYAFKYSNYCVIIYNNDSHSFPEVIRALKKALGSSCTPKDATDFATFIDKYGRGIVKVANYSDCASLMRSIELYSRRDGMSLKCAIVPTYVVAHQTFATRLLNWIATTLFQKSSGFRALFAEIAFLEDERFKITLDNEKSHTICEAVLLNDAKVWKKVRKLWLKVIIDGIMKDYDSKKALAKAYTRNYKTIMQQFVEDDQESDLSVTSLSVQIFTVPSLAHHLITEDNAFHEMILCFYTIMMNYKDKGPDDKVSINLSSWQDDEKSEFIRAQSIMTDVGYLLSIVPDTWTESLRRNFLAGVEILLNCLTPLQGMDAQTRQVGQHIEFESMEWERAYKMTDIFATVTELVAKWCRYDKGALLGTINMLSGRCFIENDNFVVKTCRVLNQSVDYEIHDYKVASMPVSTQVPLHRFLARLVPSFNNFPATGLTAKIKQRLESKGSLADLIDPVINAIVTIAQINAGMWRRNGAAADGQAYIYSHPDLCPSLKRNDLILLQTAVALSDDCGVIIMTLLQRFRLLPWANGDLDKVERKTSEFYERNNALVDEFLSLLLAIVMERHLYGVGDVSRTDELKHRLIHILCTDALPHSVVISMFGRWEEEQHDIDAIIREVAVLKSSSKDPSKRVYHLKDEFRAEYNSFYYFYTKELQSQALETQLQLRKKEGSSFCPPPILPKFSPLFENLRHVLKSLPVLQLIQTSLERAAKTGTDPNVATKHLHKILFLISVGIRDDLIEGNPSFVEAAEKLNLVDLLQKNSNNHSDELRGLFKYVINLLNEAREKLLDISSTTSSSKESAGISEGEDGQVRKRRAEAAAARRAKIMAQMTQMQKNFAKEYAMDLSDMPEVNRKDDDEDEDANKMEQDQKTQIAVGIHRTTAHTSDKRRYTCILCQEEQSVFSQTNSDALIIAAYVQKSSVLSQDPNFHHSGRGKCSQDFLPLDLSCGPYTSSCGHAMHAACYQKFFDSLVSKEQEHHQGLRPILNYDVIQNEYLCPICERLSNTVLPIMPSISTFVPLVKASTDTFYSWVRQIRKLLKNKFMEEALSGDSEGLPELSRLKLKPAIKSGGFLSSSTPNMEMPTLPQSLNNMCNLFAVTTFMKTLASDPCEEDHRVLQMIFQSCAMSIHMMEAKNYSISDREIDTIRSLVRLCVAFPMTTSALASTRHHMHRYFRSNAIYLFSLLLLNEDEDTATTKDEKKTYLHLDALEVLILLVVAHSSLIFSEEENRFHLGEQDHNIFRLCFLLYLTQAATCLPLLGGDLGVLDEDDLEVNCLIQKITQVKKRCRGIGKILRDKAVSFLRKSAQFFHFYTDIPLPDMSSYESLCAYLGIPGSLTKLLREAGVSDVIDTMLATTNSKVTPVNLPVNRRDLIPLPENYISLLSKAAQYRCNNNITGESKTPVLCLVCGTMLCLQSHCCEALMDGRLVGGATNHARKCGADIGIFLNLRECQITILADAKRGAFLPAPYVDEYGEFDEGLKRGDPLHLDKDKYEEINKLWINNEIPDRISRSFDQDILIISQNWHTL